MATGGCFDLLHAGHVAMLESARKLGDCLVVCLNSDASVRRLKGADRPLVSEDDRAAVLRADPAEGRLMRAPTEVPLPQPDAASAPFWAGCAERRLLIPKCTSCGSFQSPPRLYCRNCRGTGSPLAS